MYQQIAEGEEDGCKFLKLNRLRLSSFRKLIVTIDTSTEQRRRL